MSSHNPSTPNTALPTAESQPQTTTAHPLANFTKPNDAAENKDKDTKATAKGSCLCRAITFTLVGVPKNTVLCHCDNCAHASGVGFMANSFYNAEQLTIHTPSTLKTYTDSHTLSGATLHRQFCSTCGSPLFTSNDAFPGFVAVTSGSLEAEAAREWVPAVELFCARRRGWFGDVQGKGTERFEGML